MWPTFWILVILAIYFAPSMVAASRRHNSGAAIFALNLLLGWTVLGWIAAIVWAYTGNVAAQGPSPQTHVKCPDCRELILADARKCKHCGTALVPQVAAIPSGMRACPDCHRPAPVADKYCPTCGHAMASG
jgi:RNA polymerase subunit RPABC4/transcription elongation factor Spt4/uncharacterized membrane protein YqaE (UPF0057 family)